MRFVEAVVGELFQKVEHLGRFLGVHTILTRALFELGAFSVHRLLDLFTHGPAQQVSAAQRIVRHDLRDLHHLFLVDDDALGFFKDMVNQRMDRGDLFQPVFDLAIGRDVFHRAGTVQRHQRHDVLNTGGLHALERIHHARAFNLEHRHRLGAGVQLVRRLVVQRDGVDLVLGPLGGLIKLGAIGGDVQGAAGLKDQVHRVLDHGQRLQAQKVKLDQSRLLDPLHVELRRGHVGARITVQRHQFVRRPVGDHHTGGVRARRAQQPLDLHAVFQQPVNDFFVLGLFRQSGLIA